MKACKERRPNRNGPRHYVNSFEFIILPSRTRELKDHLASMGLKFQRDCRFSFVKFSHKEARGNGYYEQKRYRPEEAIISFARAKDMVLFKLTWNECQRPETMDAGFFYAPYVPLTYSSVVRPAAKGVGAPPVSLGPTRFSL